MSVTESPHLLDRLAPEVRDFRVHHFVLADDLGHLLSAHAAGLPEATVLYAGRALEVLAAEALGRVGLASSRIAFRDLQQLEQFNLLATPGRYWAHALRRLGNDARHVRRPVGPRDAEAALAFLERWLAWFFCTFRHGQSLARLTTDGRPLGWARGPQVGDFLQVLEAPDFRPEAALEHPAVRAADSVFLLSPTLPAVLAEVLLDRSEHAAARAVLAAGLDRFPDDPRLRQLRALSRSRTGDLAGALACVELLLRECPDDEETVGIAAGVYKRLWQAEPANTGWLERCHRAYRQGWKESARTNAYLGINAATTALWLGRPDQAGQLARQVEALLQGRLARLPRAAGAAGVALGFWDQVTLAEARLLVGETEAARAAYQAAFADHAQAQGSIAVARDQASRILQALGRGAEAATFFDPQP